MAHRQTVGFQHTGIVRRRIIAAVYGLLCHGLFVAGVGMMIFQMYFGMSRCFGVLDAPLSWLANAALLLQFPIAHSFLLSIPGRRLLIRLAPRAFSAELSATTYVIVASAQVLVLFSFWTPSGVILWQTHGALFWALTSLYAASRLLLGKAILDAGITLQTGSLGWWAVFWNVKPSYPGMPTRGLFRLCRQPIYLAFTCTVWTVPAWTPDQLFIASGLTAYCLIGPVFKEARFARRFGQKFIDCQKTHPYWLPTSRPLLRPVKRNDLSIYDTYAEHWWDGSQCWLRTLQNLVPARLNHFDRVANWRGKNVLDLGCGGGFMSEALALRGANMVGIDPAEKAVAIAQRHATHRNLSIRYLVGTGEKLPVADASVDYVVCVDVLEHIVDLGQVINEVRRVLRPGGTFLFDTINRTWLAMLVVVFFGERIFRVLPVGTHDPAKFIKPAELTAMLTACGFTVSDFAGLGPPGLKQQAGFRIWWAALNLHHVHGSRYAEFKLRLHPRSLHPGSGVLAATMQDASDNSNQPERQRWGQRGTAGALFAGKLAFENVSCSIGSTEILKNLSFVLQAGEIACLLGQSGCGKTTLLRVAAGIQQVTSGRVLLDDEEVDGPSGFVPPERRNVGLVFQDFALFPHLTVIENVAFGLNALSRKEAAKVAEHALERVGLASFSHSYPSSLSGGEQQRVALARAIVPRPQVMLMDEPFSGLDQRLRETVREETLALLKETRATCVLVTHDPVEAMDFADRILLMRAGRLIQVGTATELFNKPADLQVARFFSDVNEIGARVKNGNVETPLGAFSAAGFANGEEIVVVIRPQAVTLVNAGAGTEGYVLEARFLGDKTRLQVQFNGIEEPLAVLLNGYTPQKGETASFRVDHDHVLIFTKPAPDSI